MDEDQVVQSILRRLDHLSDEFRELRDGVRKVIRIAPDDPEMALTRARKVMEYVVRDLYVRRYKEEPGTRPLENLLQRLVRDGHLPKRLAAYANAIRELGNVGTHAYGEAVTTSDVRQSLTQLMVLLEWYFETERPEALRHTGKLEPPEVPPYREEHQAIKDESQQPASETETPQNESVTGARSAGGISRWAVSFVAGIIAGSVGGQLNYFLLRSNLTSVDYPAVLILCGVIPAVVSALVVARLSRTPLKVVLGLVLGAVVVELVFLFALLLAGGDRSLFVRHLPFWLGQGDDRIMMGEALMLALALGVLPGSLAGGFQSIGAKLLRL